MKKALIVVDVQNDFMPGGSLPVKDGDQVIPVINKLMPDFDLIIFTKDWHTYDMDAFASSHKGKKPFDMMGEDILWPDHCVAGTTGADLHKNLDFSKIPEYFYIFKKGTEKDNHPYSGFGAEGLNEFLEERGIEQLVITGLAGDFCVKDTAIDAAMLGYDTTVILDAIKFIDEDTKPTKELFVEAGVKMMESWELNLNLNLNL